MYSEYISNQIPIYAEVRGAKDQYINYRRIKQKIQLFLKNKTFLKENYDI